MTKHTEQVEREVVERVTETQEFWTCDDCKREFEEDELVPVAVDPEVDTPTPDSQDMAFELEGAMESLSPYISMGGGPAGMTNRRIEREAEKISERYIQHFSTPSTEAAASLDVCPECLKDDFGVEIEEHDGVHYDERNVEKSSSGGDFDSELFRKALAAGAVPLIGQVVSMIALVERDWDVFLGTLITQLFWVIILQAFVL